MESGRREREENGTNRKVEGEETERGIEWAIERERDRKRDRETEGRKTNPNRLYHSFLTHSQLVPNFIDLSSQGNIRQGLVLVLFVRPVRKQTKDPIAGSQTSSLKASLVKKRFPIF